MAFELPSLPYSHNALAARGMCQETLELHHGKHHQAYVTALNGFVEKNAALQGKSLDEIILFANGKAEWRRCSTTPASTGPTAWPGRACRRPAAAFPAGWKRS